MGMRGFLFIVFALVVCSVSSAQTNCHALEAPSIESSKLLFPLNRNRNLGKSCVSRLESRFRVIDEDQVTGYLKLVGQRVSRHLLETGLHLPVLFIRSTGNSGF